jgi:hypothetical protein
VKDEEMETEKAKPAPVAPAAQTEIPTKCVTSRIKTQVNCKVKFIDFEGRSDGESIKRILGEKSYRMISRKLWEVPYMHTKACELLPPLFGAVSNLIYHVRARYFHVEWADNFFQRNANAITYLKICGLE